ncbi:MAG: glutamate--tRNA ligase [Endomicrobium sp.]|jgi:glutamyl-tRNA synthetase|nr:glutamate--tRNA ligase [Endomicrobium sp.]
MKEVRVRFAPSPTGDLHIGGVHTALFNWLFARNQNGKFILRIEDTDEIRSSSKSVQIILDAMKWLKFDQDEGPGIESKYSPYYQMKRKEQGIYQKYANELVSKGFAYPCYCTCQEIDKVRKKSQANKLPSKYDKKCRYLTLEDKKQEKNKGKKAVLRFKMPNCGTTVFIDLIRGRVEFDNSLFDDFIIMKANGVPTYNFACTVDDYLMEITHVLRGDDHISNTPKQIHIYNALGWQIPEFAHMSMILGSDGTRLSKRHGHISVLEYRNEGYLQEALVNYLALLGWSTEDGRQIFNIEDLKRSFSIKRCGASPAIFDIEKLLWINGEKIRSKNSEQLLRLFIDWVRYTNNEKLIEGWDIKLLQKAIFLEQEKIKLLKDIPFLVNFFFIENIEYHEEAVSKILLSSKSRDIAELVLNEAIMRFTKYQYDFSALALEEYARNLAKEKNIKTGDVFHPIRVAVSGRTHGPSLFHMMELLGKDKIVKRIAATIKKFF